MGHPVVWDRLRCKLPRCYGAEVTAVCQTQKKIEMVRSLNPDHIIDYTQQAVTQTASNMI